MDIRIKAEFLLSRHSHAISPNLLDRNFEAAAPDAVGLADISYIPTDDGGLDLAAVKDLATMEVGGWSMSARLKSVLGRAIRNRRLPMGLIHHSELSMGALSRQFPLRLIGL